MCRLGLTCANGLANGRKGLTEHFFSPSTGADRWPWDHPPGDQCPRLDPEGWLQPNVCFQYSKGDFSWRDSA